jgi:nicotinamidase-related amidase
MSESYRAADAVLVVVDVQDKLLAKMPQADALVRSIGFLMDAAELLGVPIRATEQYPKGLGPTTADLARRLRSPIPAKTAFSCCGAEGFVDELRALGRRTVVLTGMEAHVCVAQTALDLLAHGFRVVLPLDAIDSRHELDKVVAVRRLERIDAILTTAEAVVFEWGGNAAHPSFKAISRLVIDRPRDSGK